MGDRVGGVSHPLRTHSGRGATSAVFKAVCSRDGVMGRRASEQRQLRDGNMRIPRGDAEGQSGPPAPGPGRSTPRLPSRGPHGEGL